MTTIRDYSTRGTAISALRNYGLNLVPHSIRQVKREGATRFRPVFYPELAEDREYLRQRGWAVEVPASDAVKETGDA